MFRPILITLTCFMCLVITAFSASRVQPSISTYPFFQPVRLTKIPDDIIVDTSRKWSSQGGCHVVDGSPPPPATYPRVIDRIEQTITLKDMTNVNKTDITLTGQRVMSGTTTPPSCNITYANDTETQSKVVCSEPFKEIHVCAGTQKDESSVSSSHYANTKLSTNTAYTCSNVSSYTPSSDRRNGIIATREMYITLRPMCWSKSTAVIISFPFDVSVPIPILVPRRCRDCYTSPSDNADKRLILKHGQSRTCSGRSCSCNDGQLKCQGCLRRYPWQMLSSSGKVEFFNTLNDVAKYHYADYASLLLKHGMESGQAHFGNWFALWHQRYLYEFEQLLQRINKCVSLPYIPEWIDATDGTTEWSIWDTGVMGQPSFNPTTAFGMYDTSVVPMPGSFSRNYCRGSNFNWNSAPSWSDVQALIAINDFDNFASMLEGAAHTYYHNSVGSGNCAVGGFDEAPYDPTFFMHHAFIDRVFCMWRAQHPAEWSSALSTHGSNLLTSDWGTWQDTVNHLGDCPCNYNGMYTLIPIRPPVLVKDLWMVSSQRGVNLPSILSFNNTQKAIMCRSRPGLTDQQSAWIKALPDKARTNWLNTHCTLKSFREELQSLETTPIEVQMLTEDIDEKVVRNIRKTSDLKYVKRKSVILNGISPGVISEVMPRNEHDSILIVPDATKDEECNKK